MTFASTFGRVLSPTFQPNSQAVGGKWWLAGNINPANCVAAYQAKGAASYAASKVNLANPGTYDATGGNAPDWDATNGWKFDGVNDYLDTGISVDGGGYSVIARFSNRVGGNSRLFGTAVGNNGDPRMAYIPAAAAFPNRVYYANGTLNSYETGWVDAGVIAIAGNKAYKNGSPEDGTLTAWSGTNTNSLFISAQNNGGTAIYFLGCYIQAFAIYDTQITDTQVALLTTAMNAL